MKLGPLHATNNWVPLSAMLTGPDVPATAPSVVTVYVWSTLYRVSRLTTYRLPPNSRIPRIGPAPTDTFSLMPGARLRKAGSLPPSGMISGNRLTMRAAAAFTLRATYDDPRIGVFIRGSRRRC